MATENEFQETVLPLIVFFIILNLVGFFGNALVIFIYYFRYRKNHFRILVLLLGFADLFSSCTTVPMETVSTWFWFSTPSRVLCKAKNFCVQFSALTAIFTLFITAIYKYCRICRQKEVSKRFLVALYLAGVGVSFVLATPAAILWDVNKYINTYNASGGNTTETLLTCEVHTRYRQTSLPVGYRTLLYTYTVLLVIAVILYVMIARTTVRHILLRRRKCLNSQPAISQSARPSSSVATMPKPRETYEMNVIGDTSSKSQECTTHTKRLTIMDLRINQKATLRTEKIVILLIIVGAFSVTLFMGLSFGYMFAVNSYNDHSSLSEMVLYFACYRFYFINYALNPIVYITLDRRFRKQLRICFDDSK